MCNSVTTTHKQITIYILQVIGLLGLCGCNNSPLSRTDAEFQAESLESRATRIIQEALAGNNPQVRASAIEVVAAIPANQGRKLMPQVQRLLRDELVPVRFAAAVAVGDTRYTPAKSDVRQLLEDKDENIKIAAGYAVDKLGADGGLEIIRRAMANPDQQVRANASFLLGKTGDKSNLPILYEAIKNESSDDRIRLSATEAIARLGDDKIYQKLWAMLISAYADDRAFGVRAMGALGTSQAKEAILTMLKDDLTEVRLVAAEQLAKLGDTTGEKIVLEALTRGASAASDQEEKARLQTLSAMAIGQIKTVQLKKFLPELLKNESQLVRLAAAGAVFQCIESR